MRNSRALMPPRSVTSRAPMNGKPSFDRSSAGSTISCSRSRVFGPAIENCAHWSDTEVSCTSSSGNSTCRQNSRCCITSPALAVVVVRK